MTQVISTAPPPSYHAVFSRPLAIEEWNDLMRTRFVDAGLATVNELNIFHGKIPVDKYCILVPRILPASEFKAVMGMGEYRGKKGYSYIDPTYHSDIIKLPDRPFIAVGIEDGRSRLNTKPSESYQNILAEGREPYPTLVGLCHYIAFGEFLESHNMDFVGSRYGSGIVPGLGLDGGGPGLDADFFDGADPKWGAPSCEEWVVP